MTNVHRNLVKFFEGNAVRRFHLKKLPFISKTARYGRLYYETTALHFNSRGLAATRFTVYNTPCILKKGI